MRRLIAAFLLALPALGADLSEIDALVKGLGSADWKERDRAVERLVEIGLPAEKAVAKAAQDPDEEVSWRARRALTAIRRTHLTLRVMLAADGRPAAGIGLRAGFLAMNRGESHAQEFAATTGEDGTAVLPRPLEPASYLFQLSSPGFLPVKVEPVRLRGGARTLSVRLERGTAVSGTLRFHDGRPAKGVAVGLLPAMEPAQIHRYAEISRRRECVADAEGRFAFDPAPEGEYRIAVETVIGSMRAKIRLVRSLVLREGGALPPLTLALPADPATALDEAILSGRCLDKAGRPMAGAKLRLFLDGVAGWPESSQDRVPVGADGRFEALVPAGRLWVNAVTEGHAPATVGPVRLAPGENPDILLVLGPGGSLKGTVEDAHGKPMKDAEIGHYHPGRIEAGTPEASLFMDFHADKGGRFSILNAMPGDWEVRATAEDKGLSEPTLLRVQEGRPQTLKLVVPEGAGARGTVSCEDGTACAKAELRAFAEAWQNRASDPWEPYVAVSGNAFEGGAFELVLPFPGRWWIVAEQDGYEPASSGVFEARRRKFSEALEIRLARPEPGAARVRAVDAAGRPVPGAQVQILSHHPVRAPVTADAGGEAWIEALPAGSYPVVAAKPGLAPGLATADVPPGGEATITCILSEGASVAGRLADAAGAPVAGRAVWAWRAEFSVRHREEQMGAAGWEAVTDADGRYRLARLPQGRLKVMPAPDGRAAAIRMVTVPAPGGAVEDVDFTLAEGVPAEVTVLDAGGAPVANAAVEAYPAGFLVDPYSVDLYAVSFTDAKGVARLPGLPPGEPVDLLASRAGHPWAFLRGRRVPAAGAWTEEVRLAKPGRLEGRVACRPPARFSALLADNVFALALGPGAGKARLRGDGTFVFERLAPGDYEVFLTVGNRRLAGVTATVEEGRNAACVLAPSRPLPVSRY